MSDRAPTTSRLEEALHAGDLLDPRVSLHWEHCTDSPVECWIDPVWFNGKLYIRGGRRRAIAGTALLSVYTPSEDSWEVIPTPTKDYVLTTYHSQLLLVGRDRYTSSQTNSVWVLEDHHWALHPTIQALPAHYSVLNAVEFGDYLIVHVRVTVFSHGTILMVWNGLRWFAVDCPQLQSAHLFLRCSHAVNGDDWYLSEGDTLYRVSLRSVVASAESQGAQPAAVWEKLPDPPHKDAPITWFGGHLLAVGGCNRHTTQRAPAIHAYNQQARSWEHVSDLPGGSFFSSSCAALPTGELLVAEEQLTTSSVLKATIRASPEVVPAASAVDSEASSSKSTSELLHTAEGKGEAMEMRTVERMEDTSSEESIGDLFHTEEGKGKAMEMRTVERMEEASSEESIGDLFHSVEEAVAELGNNRNRKKVQKAMDALAALKERVTGKESEHSQQPAAGVLTHTPLKAGGLEAEVKAKLSLSEHGASDDPMSDMFDFLQDNAIRFETEVIGSKAPLKHKTLRAARKRYFERVSYLEKSLELPNVFEVESAMQLQAMPLLPTPDPSPQHYLEPVKQECLLKQLIQVKQEYKQEPMTIAVPTLARHFPTVLRGVEAIAETHRDHVIPPPTVLRGVEAIAETHRDHVILPPTVLRGVEAIAETHLLITNSGRSFHWEGCGLKLTFPPHCLPPGVDECLLRIQASTSGQYQFPDDSLLVSGVYAISCSSEVTFTRPATLELQHCSEHDNELSFAVAKTSKDVPPYKFSRCKGAVFSKLSAYGSLEVHSFSLFAIIAKAFSSLGRRILSPRRYCGNIYKARSAESPNVWSVYFIITQNLDVHRKSAAAFASENDASSHHHELTLQFKDDSVRLDTRESNLTDWEISACKPIMITRAEVDDFRHGRRVPHCHLEVEWTGSGRVGKLKHDVAVIGALPEGQSFPICIYPELSAGKRSNEGGEQSQGPRSKRSKEEKLTAVSGATEVVSLSDLNSLSELLVSIAGHWELFLTALGVSVDEQARIKVQYANSPKSATHCLLTGLEGWVKSSDHPTYGDIIEALQGGLVTDKPLASQVERFALQKAHSRAAVAAVARGKDKLVEEASASSSNAATLTDLSYNT